MTDSRAVINPFAKSEHRMRRNTSNTQWVTAESSSTHQAGPSKKTQIVTPRLRHDSQEASMYEDADSVSPRTCVVPAVKDSTRSVSPVSPLVSVYTTRRDSPVSAVGAIDFSGLEQARKGSECTVFPYYPASLKKPETRPATRSDGWYSTARHIYKAGPAGEGQKAWKLFRTLRSEQSVDAAALQQKKGQEMYNKSLPPLPAPSHPEGVLYPPLRPRPIQARSEGKWSKVKVPKSPCARKDSEFSQTSYEVPIAIDGNVHNVVDTNKPLPPAPHLDPAPKAQKTIARGQAQTTVQSNGNNNNINSNSNNAVGAARAANSKQGSEKEAAHHAWWKPLPSKAAAPSLKTKISYPGPLVASSNGLAVNVAVEPGGVGGPAAAISLPVTRTGAFIPHAQTREAARKEARKEARKGKGKGKDRVKEREAAQHTLWRNRSVGPAYGAGKSFKPTLDDVHHVGRRRRKSSDASFCCQGVDEAPLGRYQVSVGRTSAKEEEEGAMLPLPLFSGMRGGRDTKFYQPYVEVLDEY